MDIIDFSKKMCCISACVKLSTAALLKNGRVPQELCKFQEYELDSLLSFASLQGVLSPVIALLISMGVLCDELTDEMYEYVGEYVQNENDYCNKTETMRKFSRLCANEGLDVMFIKGATLARYYPCPDWRTWSDIDYYLYGKSDKGNSVLKSKGIKIEGYYHHHTQSVYNGILMENHYDFLDRLNHRCNHLLDDALKELAEKEGKTCPFTFEDNLSVNNAYMMTPTMNAIFLMRHMSAHFVSETVTLRQLYDFALFLNADGDEVDWKKILDLYEKSGMVRFAKIIVAIIHDKLGFELSKEKCPIPIENSEMVEKVWQSIITFDQSNPYQRYSFMYMIREAATFFKNKWKHSLVYPSESYLKLFFIYGESHVRRILGLNYN